MQLNWFCSVVFVQFATKMVKMVCLFVCASAAGLVVALLSLGLREFIQFRPQRLLYGTLCRV
jgi:hypothetical protein